MYICYVQSTDSDQPQISLYKLRIHALCKQFVDLIAQTVDSYIQDIYIDTLSHFCSTQVRACTYCRLHVAIVPPWSVQLMVLCDATLFTAGKASKHVVNAEVLAETES